VEAAVTLSNDTLNTSGILLLTIVAVESGGVFMLRVVRGAEPATGLQRAFFRAGHAHAGVLVILSLLAQILADAAGMSSVADVLARSGIPLAAILMPTGFFLSVTGRGVTRPNPLILLIYLGALSLAAGVIALGIGLLTA